MGIIIKKYLIEFIEILSNLEIYPCYQFKNKLSKEKFKKIYPELLELAKEEYGNPPQYQCFINNYDKMHDKLLLIKRDKYGKITAFSSAIVFQANQQSILHLGIYLVSQNYRNNAITPLLTVITLLTYIILDPFKKKFYITNVSSVIPALSMVFHGFISVFPSPTNQNPTYQQLEIAKYLNENPYERFFVKKECQFIEESFIYKEGDKGTCFIKQNSQYKFSENYIKKYYANYADFDNGDTILQVAHVTHLHFIKQIVRMIYLKCKRWIIK